MSIHIQAIRGDWNHLCSLARKRWSQLTEHDLRVNDGNIEQLFDRIQQKTGEGREAIEQLFSAMTSRGSLAVAYVAESGRQYGQQVSDQIQDRYEDAEGLVHDHPTGTVTAALGIGLLAGLAIGLAIRAH